MASYDLLEQSEEDELHKSRLLAVEKRPFERITKRLLTPGSLISTPSKLPTPPAENSAGSEPGATEEIEIQKQLEERRQFREDILLDFAAFDTSIARIQFLRNSNERERERYAAEKLRILEAAQNVRDNTAQLRTQLESSRQTLEQRKKFDELAEKITNNRMLRPRTDQEINLKKLEEECAELERESQTYAETWKERREQFGRIVEEGMQLRRLIRDEKEEVERREGMAEGEEDGEAADGATPRTSHSGNATPRPDSENTPGQSRSRGNTPAVEDEKLEGLKPKPFSHGGLSRNGSNMNSRTQSPAAFEHGQEELEEGEDTTMADELSAKAQADVDMSISDSALTPRVTLDTAEGDDKMDTT